MNALVQFFIGAKRQAPIDSLSNRRVLALTYFFYFGQLGIFVPYVGMFLDGRDFSSTQIGTLLALVALARILGPNLWANLSDKSGKVGEVLRLGCLLGFLSFLLIFVVYDHQLLTLTFFLMMMFWTAVLPQLEVITVQATENSKGGYGKLRLWGSIGFIVCSLLVGALIDVYGPEVTIVASSIVLFVLYICSLLVTSSTVKLSSEHSSRGDWKQAVSFVFIIFLLANALLQVSFGAYYNFFALYMKDQGYSGLDTGIFIALGVVAEVFIFIYAAQLLKRFKVMHLLAFSIFLTGFRWLALAYFAHIFWVIVVSQLIHALSFGLAHAASVFFLAVYFSKQFQSRAQALYVSIAFGIGGAAGSYMSGYLWQQGEGAMISFNFSAAMAFLGGFILVMLAVFTSIQKATQNAQKQ